MTGRSLSGDRGLDQEFADLTRVRYKSGLDNDEAGGTG